MVKKKKRQTVKGILSKHRRGFGFVINEDRDEDIFIPRNAINTAMDGDEVEVDLIPMALWKNSPEGVIINVINRKLTEVVGTFEKVNKNAFIIPEGKNNTEDIFVKREDFRGAKDGDKVVVKITKYPQNDNKAEGKIIEIVSRFGEPGSDIKAIARSYGLLDTFPSRVNAEAKAMKKQGISKEDIKERRDIRNKNLFTIDGSDSKDFDDAVSIELLENKNYLLGVHIADVSHYVEEDGFLDKEAIKRGTSVYLLNQVIPMLPMDLSNDICSLNPNKDRLALSVDIEVSPLGKIVDHEIYESVIKSKARLVYDVVSDFLEDGNDEGLRGNEDVKIDLRIMSDLADILNAKRHSEGSLDFDLDEPDIRLDKNGFPKEISISQRRTSNKMIEEFMLLANEVVAEHFYWMEIPFIYRVHEKPELDKLERLKIFLRSFGLSFHGKGENIKPKAISDVLEQVKGKPNEKVVSYITLRTMQKAEYSDSCDGHFGLALKYYSHFTSPIRRYPDLMIHRIIKDIIKNASIKDAQLKYGPVVGEVARLSSRAEKEAVEVEREVVKLKKAEYISKYMGQSFQGVISGITSFGMYVQLENTVEGLVRMDSLLDDFYEYKEEEYSLVGQSTNRTYRLGDTVMVKVGGVNVERREIDFIICSFPKNCE